MGITHAFTSGKSDGVDGTLVQPSNWNAAHTITSVPATGVISTSDTTAATSKTVGSIVAGGGIAASGALYCDTITSAGTGTPATFSNAEFITYDTYPGFLQVVAQNLSTNAAASTDFIATKNDGTDSTGYVDFGINGSAYSVGTWTINGASDGYGYCAGGNLALGTDTAGKNLVLFTGGTLAANARLTIADALITSAEPISITDATSTALQVTGGINKVTITAPTTSATLTLVTGSTLQTTGAFTLNLTTTAASTPTFPTGTGTLVYLGGTNTWSAVQTLSVKPVLTLGGTLTASAATTTEGDFWNDSTQKAHAVYQGALKQMLVGCVFTQTATGTNGAATAITSILGTGVGTTALPASHSLIGKTVRVRAWGTVTTAAAPGTTVLTLRWNAATPVSIVASPSLTLTASMTSMPFFIDLFLTYRTTTTAIAGGTFTVSNSTTGISALVVPIGTTTAATIVAATSYTPQICATNGTASGTVYTTQGSTIEVLN